MTTLILDGKAVAQRWLAGVRARVQQQGRAPRLVILQVGNVPASTVYVEKKLQAAASVGIKAEKVGLPTGTTEDAILAQVRALAQDKAVDALLVQTPLPVGINTQRVLDAVPWHKDVDGLSAASAQRRALGQPCHGPATPTAILRVLKEEWQHELLGLKVAVIGNGRVVGEPLRALLAQAGAEVLAIDKDTPHPQALCRSARVVVAACGVPGLVNAHWVARGADVVDVGLTPVVVEGRTLLRGDVEAMSIEGVAARRTPAPGGIGPLTVAQLLTNVSHAAALAEGV